ncbi:vacuolar protein sorting-associated protein 35 domain-containing protein [Ditylenchus destructor]|uniref:Vacuolar protein sorting-associated protein 35 domain-containing protein n=1 Tax=Ditylenchus destructor TaxID=166010 RepID=A0AAD4N1S2_9BILA|nr:vacuolar protein sorting-associated protein 35 domain-containing protein [Ditylenchus destructor]
MYLQNDHCFIPLSTPVFAHPLLKNARLTEPKTGTLPGDDSNSRTNGPSTSGAEPDLPGDVPKFLDPLGAFSSGDSNGKQSSLDHKLTNGASRRPEEQTDGLESLTGALDNTLKSSPDEAIIDLDVDLLGFRPWRELRHQILQHFITKDQLTLETSFLSTKGQQPFQEKKRALNSDVPRTLIKFYDLTPEMFVRKLGDLKTILCQKWKQEKRIECIKLITEVARMLSSASVAHFYPAQFVYVTDLLDFFGNLVYERLLQRAKKERIDAGLPPLPSKFFIHDVLEKTRITARNWFGKVSEIRELIPRIYVECALLRCMNFMDQSAINANVMKLCALAKSVQHPLISSYARCYICRVAMRLNAADRAPHWKCLNDWMQTYSQQPTSLLWAALQYVIQCVSYNAVTYDDLSPLWEYCRLPQKRSLILCSMLNGVPPVYLTAHALEASRLVTGSEHVTGEEIAALGCNLLRTEVSESVRKPLLKSMWKCIARLSSVKSYVKCCDVWIEFVAKYFTTNELQIILENVIKKLMPEKKYEYYYESLLSMLRKMLANVSDVSEILTMEIFPQFIDIFRDENSKRTSTSLVLNALVNRHSTATFSDFSLAFQVMDVCKRISETVSVLTPEVELESVSTLIQAAMDRFDLAADPEQALSFYVSFRASMLNNDSAQKYVILRIMSLALHVARSIKFSTSRSSFLQACIANLFITIPSLPNPAERLTLSIQSARVALASLAYLQVDAFVRLCLEIFSELPIGSVQQFYSEGTYFVSLITSVPSADGRSPLKTLCKFLDIIRRYQWPVMHPNKAHLLLDCLQCSFIISRTQIAGQFDDQMSEFGQLCYERADEIVMEIKPFVETETLDRLNVCMRLVEIISFYAQQEFLSDTVQSIAKDSFRLCKRSSAMSNRIKMLKANSQI